MRKTGTMGKNFEDVTNAAAIVKAQEDTRKASEEEEKKQEARSAKTFDEIIEQYEDLFRRTISNENKQEVEFAPEYA